MLQSLYEKLSNKTTLCFTRGTQDVLLDGAKLTIISDDRQNTVPLDRIRRVVILGKFNLDSEVFQSLIKNGIPIDFLNLRGEIQAHLLPVEDPCDYELTLQGKLSADEYSKLELAREILRAKADNSASILNKRIGLTPIWSNCIKLFQDASNEGELRGAEGYTARTYFSYWQSMLSSRIKWQGRQYYPAPDPVNALLSLCYVQLYNRFVTALRSYGLNPRLGFFHHGRGGHCALASDLMEPIRPLIDNLVLNLFKDEEVTVDNFETVDRVCRIKDRKVFSKCLKALEELFSSTITFHFKQGPLWHSCSRTLYDHIDDAVLSFHAHLTGVATLKAMRFLPCTYF